MRVPEAASVARHLLRTAEAEAITTLAEPARTRLLLETWVAKEAVVKATGEGLARDLRSFGAEPGPGWRPVTWYEDEGPALLIADVPLDDCVVALALTGGEPHPSATPPAPRHD